jgi:hypothetical protein
VATHELSERASSASAGIQEPREGRREVTASADYTTDLAASPRTVR